MYRENQHLYEFGPFRLDPQRRQLRRGDTAVPLTPKAFETLLVLVENRNRVVPKDDLMKTLWPDSFVEESNLSQNIFVLRKALDDSAQQKRYIANVPGRGYQFVETVRDVGLEEEEELVVATHSSSRVLIEETKSRSGLFWAGLALLLLIGGGGGALFYRVEHRGGSSGQNGSPSAGAVPTIRVRRSVAVMGFRNLSGRSDQAWLSTALAEMLDTELAAGGELRTVPGEQVARSKIELSIPDADSLAKDSLQHLHTNLNTDYVVLGAYTVLASKGAGKDKGTDQLRLDLRLQDASAGETVSEEAFTGTADQLFDLVSHAGAQLRGKLGVADVSEGEASVVRASLPVNPRAMRLYSEGLAKLRVFEAAAARDLLVQAIDADPRYPMAHWALSSAWSTLGYDANARQEAEKAFNLSTPLSQEERSSIEARYRATSREWPKAVEIYQTLWHDFPDDIEYGLQLTSAQTSAGQLDQALATVAEMRKLPAPANSDPRIDLLEDIAAEAKGDFKRSYQAANTAETKAAAMNARLLLASALTDEGWAWVRLGQPDKAQQSLALSKTFYEAAGDHRAAAVATDLYGDALLDKDDFAGAEKNFTEALTICRQIGNQWCAGRSWNSLGNLYHDQNRTADAKKCYEQVLAINREIGNKPGEASALGNLANLLQDSGDLSGGRKMQEAALQIFTQLGDKRGMATTLNNLGNVLADQGDLAGARKNSEQALAIGREIGFPRVVGYALESLTDTLQEQDQLADARKAQQEEQSVRQSLGKPSGMAVCELQDASLALEEGRAADAEKLAREAAGKLETLEVLDTAAEGYASLSRSLLAQGKLPEAQSASAQAASLAQKSGRRTPRLEATVAAAQVLSANGKNAAARQKLEEVASEAAKYGYISLWLNARLELGMVEMKSGQTASARASLAAVEKDARARGFLLVARKASTARS
jgi:DNA-binding winged helix-turn-helix (wHTH) protein/tetratricopeptide (TPR) repeat protein